MLKRNFRPAATSPLKPGFPKEVPEFRLELEGQPGKLFRVLSDPRVHYLCLALITIGAFLMRRKGLATQSLWFDEADLASRASQDLASLLKAFIKPGENGPLYTFFMHFWLQFAGKGEAALRTPSLLAGTLAVPLIFLVGRKLGGTALGILAAFLLAISPYHLWYSQDAKMYPLALCVTLASVFLFLKGLELNRPGWWAGYVIITTLGFYIHLMTVLIVLVEVSYYFVLKKFFTQNEIRRLENRPVETGSQPPLKPRKIFTPENRAGLIALGILTLPYLPIALWQLVALRDGTVGLSWFKPVGILEMLDSLGRRFGVNRSSEPWESIGAVVYAALALLGGWAAWFQKGKGLPSSPYIRQKTPLFLTIYFFLPLLAFYLLTTRIPLFADRYLLIASPAYYLLVAWGLLWLFRKFWPLGLGLAVLAMVCAVIALRSFNYSTEPQKEDWRGAMQWLNGQVRPGDEVFVIPGYMDTAVNYYFKPEFEVPVYTIPGALLDDNDDIQLNDFLQKAIRGHERAWLVVSPDRYSREDPKEFVRTVWFNYNTFMFSHPEVKVGATIYGYTFKLIPGTNSEFFPHTTRTRVTFGETLRLEGFDYAVAPGNTPGTVRVNNFLHLTLYWRKLNYDKANYEMSIRLLDQAGLDTGITYSALPLNGYFTTNNWHYNEAVRDYRELFIRVPPGQYQLEIKVFPARDPGEALKIGGEDQNSTSYKFSQPVVVLPEK